MGAFYDEIPPNILEWIPKQHIFFVASAALRSKPGEAVSDNRKNVAGRRVDEWGYANVSPKEMALFNVYLKERPTLDVWARKRECLDLDIPYDDSVDEEAQIANTDGSIIDKQLALDNLLKKTLAEKNKSGAKIQEKGGLQQYWDLKNNMSLDGLPALSNLAPVSGSNTPAPYGYVDESVSSPLANGKLPVQKETFNRDEVRDIVMRERRRMSSNRWADLYVALSVFVLGLALGFGLREPIHRLFDML
ncbi:hypothetical protein QFC22_004803 [Naganishia vaughanmartiniae]|uniref:Uncharacterized protein n=1 Tax=Naganishia vaughanmartiniae TaxID=1424756 RepID=A0ACC2WXH7_9TREE|nr:hypothetical protein QFC22_004803 [Naganishia vaughanmartiniae]